VWSVEEMKGSEVGVCGSELSVSGSEVSVGCLGMCTILSKCTT